MPFIHNVTIIWWQWHVPKMRISFIQVSYQIFWLSKKRDKNSLLSCFDYVNYVFFFIYIHKKESLWMEIIRKIIRNYIKISSYSLVSLIITHTHTHTFIKTFFYNHNFSEKILKLSLKKSSIAWRIHVDNNIKKKQWWWQDMGQLMKGCWKKIWSLSFQ